ncbi:hypothetical protein [Thalassomonas sp. RHCl1]|uniref:hypothetical protein n=1 Tax=Thalassomonas sp. RHCl1 TaxID=2995320 RepID=UPI00248D0C88|nr:hypothetical protein [Thalassomonas sp. RHCl1]
MKKLLMSLLTLTISQQVMAESALTEIKVSDDILYFATSEEQTATVSCVQPENTGTWAVSMNSSTGKNAYTALMTAAATGQKITVVSANDCADKSGFERPASIAVSSN